MGEVAALTTTGGAVAGGKAGHIRGLDGIRAIAVLLVLLSHSGLGKQYTGRTGVTVFFFLSGYLITTLMRREQATTGGISIREFYIRRAFRILPPFYLMMATATAACMLGVIGGGVSLRATAWALGFLGNYFMLDPHHLWPDGFGVTWSLAVEEHFYLVFPLLYVGILHWTARRQALLLSGLCVAALAWRCWLFYAWHAEAQMYLGTDSRFDALLFGCILAIAGASIRERLRGVWGGPLALFCGAGVLGWEHMPWVKGPLAYTLTSLSLIPVFCYVLENPGHAAVRWLEARVLRRVGVLSYSIYLFHEICISVFAHLTHFAAPVCALLGLPVCYGVALAVERFVDQPAHRLRQRVIARVRAGGAVPVHVLPVYSQTT